VTGAKVGLLENERVSNRTEKQMNCDFCSKRVAKFIVLVQNKETNICQFCNKRWQLTIKAVA